MLKFNINTENRVKPSLMINIGACLDVSTSSIITGKEGESILNGGLAHITALVGTGNNFKSTILHYMMLSAANRIKESSETYMLTYDTECNTRLDRLEALTKNFDNIPENPIQSEDPIWSISDRNNTPANKWAEWLQQYTTEKANDKGSSTIFQPFKDPYSNKQLVANIPSFVEIDSYTEFDPESSLEMLTKDLDTSESNTFAMRQGLFKTKFMSTLPSLSTKSNTYFLLSAHLGEKIDMAVGPARYAQPTKKLQHLKQGDSIKSVGSNFTFLTSTLWYAHTASVLINQTTKEPEYPVEGNDKQRTDLNTVKLTLMRNKNGPSGHTITLVISQVEGVLPSLTEFVYIKENNYYGLDGNNRTFSLDLYPGVKLSRTTIRGKIDSDPRLRRALTITAELHQLGIFHPVLQDQGLMCTPKELYEDIKKLGYDWDTLLDTRGYWTINQYDNKIPFLSTVDLLKMRKGIYHPYFLKEDKITLKPKYEKKEKK